MDLDSSHLENKNVLNIIKSIYNNIIPTKSKLLICCCYRNNVLLFKQSKNLLTNSIKSAVLFAVLLSNCFVPMHVRIVDAIV